ncbi:serine/threonine-protein kinase [Tripterygium wilfordii]|uniref:non-specific serine/threonine protein kinase n=1 Tax=Tripterygium wilfordii TaxID=458696 RepID=A0A7J7E359_TRIWF|nr:probable serine/threonine-protein kinase At1g01540 [Tripterygium wilfordii]KAF5752894.1 serine/threonine-protein kinase [Tripterygium wilfordii]
MSDHKTTGLMSDQLSKSTSIFGIRLWVVVGVCVGAAIVLFLFLISLWLASKRSKKQNSSSHGPKIPIVSKEIQEVKIDTNLETQPDPFPEPEQVTGIERQALLLKPGEESPMGYHGIQIEIGKDHRISYPGSSGESRGGGDQVAMVVPEVSHLGWGHWYTLRELEEATNGFTAENVIGEGGYGIVYHGVLADSTDVAVKNLLNNRGQAEREFKVEVEAIGRVRHKNLVRLLGYCAEGAHRMLVYEYVNNGNLEQWLHGDVGPCSPLSWEIRMNIILGTAKGLTYLHEGLEPKVVHRDIKSSNILLDKQWNSKVSDFGLAKLLGSESNYITTRVMGTFGYVAPEYASTGMLNERSDVYSFGILIMELISGRNPVDYSRPPEEVNLVDWIKKMVTNRNPDGVLDPKLPEKPTSRALKRALLVALRCVDPNAQKRPKMGHVVHMLEADVSPFKDDHRAGKDAGHSNHNGLKDGASGDPSGCDSGQASESR